MSSRLLVAAIVGIAVAVALTRAILYNDFIRIWLINVPSLLTWGAAFVTGILVALIAPQTFEISAAITSMVLGSIIGVVAFGTGMNVSLADQSVLTYILMSLLVSGLCLLVLSGLGGWLVAAVRERTDSESIRVGGGGLSRRPKRGSSRRSGRSQYQ